MYEPVNLHSKPLHALHYCGDITVQMSDDAYRDQNNLDSDKTWRDTDHKRARLNSLSTYTRRKASADKTVTDRPSLDSNRRL